MIAIIEFFIFKEKKSKDKFLSNSPLGFWPVFERHRDLGALFSHYALNNH